MQEEQQREEGGRVWADYGTPGWFSLTGCRGDEGALGKGVGANIGDPRFRAMLKL